MNIVILYSYHMWAPLLKGVMRQVLAELRYRDRNRFQRGLILLVNFAVAKNVMPDGVFLEEPLREVEPRAMAGGGCSNVLRAQTRKGARVAVKMLFANVLPEEKNRFARVRQLSRKEGSLNSSPQSDFVTRR
jgi:hypothetical protein